MAPLPTAYSTWCWFCKTFQIKSLLNGTSLTDTLFRAGSGLCYLPEAGLLDLGESAFAASLPLGCGPGTPGPPDPAVPLARDGKDGAVRPAEAVCCLSRPQAAEECSVCGDDSGPSLIMRKNLKLVGLPVREDFASYLLIDNPPHPRRACLSSRERAPRWPVCGREAAWGHFHR